MYSLREILKPRAPGLRASFRQLQLKSRPQRRAFSVDAAVDSGASESPKSWRENPNLKYWVIGIVGVTGSLYYYFYKDRDKKRLRVKLLPQKSTHHVHPRNSDMEGLQRLHGHLRNQSSFVVLPILGPSGYGKTTLACAFAEKLFAQEEEKYEFIPGNHLLGTVNASSMDSAIFDMKKLSIVLGCSAQDWTSRASPGNAFGDLGKEEQLRCLVGAVREKFAASPGWVVILDNAKDDEALKRAFFGESLVEEWGRGTVLITSEGRGWQNMFSTAYQLDKGCVPVHHIAELLPWPKDVGHFAF